MWINEQQQLFAMKEVEPCTFKPDLSLTNPKPRKKSPEADKKVFVSQASILKNGNVQNIP